jgi:hypothetical protein
VATRTLHGVARGVGWHASISARPTWAATPQQNGAIFAVIVHMELHCAAEAATGDGVAGTPILSPRCSRTRTVNHDPRAVQLLLLDHQIAAALPLTQRNPRSIG